MRLQRTSDMLEKGEEVSSCQWKMLVREKEALKI